MADNSDSVKLPLTDVVDLARRYTADEWLAAARRAGDYGVEQVCAALYRFRLADPDGR